MGHQRLVAGRADGRLRVHREPVGSIALVCAVAAWHADGVAAQTAAEMYPGDIKSVLLTESQIHTRTAELGAAIGECYRGLIGSDDLLLVTVLKGAVMFVSDLARAIPLPTQL